MSLESVLYFYAHVNHTLVHLMNRNQSGETSEVFLVQPDYPMIKKKSKTSTTFLDSKCEVQLHSEIGLCFRRPGFLIFQGMPLEQ